MFNDLSNECGIGTLKVFSMNIRSLPKHKGELVAYLSNLPLFDILVLTEIGSRNIDLARNLLPGYDFMYVIYTNEKYSWGSGIILERQPQQFYG